MKWRREDESEALAVSVVWSVVLFISCDRSALRPNAELDSSVFILQRSSTRAFVFHCSFSLRLPL